MRNIDEKAEEAACDMSFGKWWQTIEEVLIRIDCQTETSSKNIKCTFSASNVNVSIDGQVVLKGELYKKIQPSDSTWTLEDKKYVSIILAKANPGPGNVWTALLAKNHTTGDLFELNAYNFDLVQKKLTLERYQRENPGMDFSDAEITGNYHGGGPQLPI